jgi:DNA primase
MSSSVDQIKSKIDIVTLVSSYIKLDKAGANFKGRCPFHNEKTPSFFVSPDRGNYYCFGCHAKGDIFSFVEEFEGLDFVGALKVLADKAGVELDSYQKGEKSHKDKLYSVLEQAVFFYQKNLEDNNSAQDYLESRGITKETIKEFRIGLATSEWRDLYDYLSGREVSVGDMIEVGLLKKKEDASAKSSSAYYDTFRGRIMFPISDSSGRVVGFSGRILIPDDKSPKYLNSPETILFNKSEILFGLDKAKTDIRLKDYSILVEGQMDLVMLHQAQIKNTVASSGTALTQEHLIKLRRLSNRIIMAYDGDSAGFAAANRSAQIALSLGMELKIAAMPEGKDPADLAKEDVSALKNVLRGSKHIIDFYTDALLSKKLTGRALGLEIRKNVLPYVALLPSTIEKDSFIKDIAKKAFIKEEALWEDLKQVGNNDTIYKPKEEAKSPPKERIRAIERKIIGILLWQKENKNGTSVVNIQDIEKRVREILGDRLDSLTMNLEKEKESLIFETESYYNDKTNLKRDIEELVVGLEEEELKKKFSEAMINLQIAEQTKNSSDVLKFLEECQQLSQKINNLKLVHELYEKSK